MPDADPVTQEAYSHELISFGFWAGDQRVREPTYYSYTAPEPTRLREQPLAPAAARWLEQDGGSLAVLPYDAVRDRDRPESDAAHLPGERLSGRREPQRDGTPPTWRPPGARSIEPGLTGRQSGALVARKVMR